MSYTFVKAEALGNDFVILEHSSPNDLSKMDANIVKRLSDRRRGIGCDQLITFYLKDRSTVHVAFYNQDGQEALACGNGSRALVNYLNETNRLDKTVTLHTKTEEIVAQSLGHRNEDKGHNPQNFVSLEFNYPHFSKIPELLSLNRIPGLEKNYDLVNIGNSHLIGFVPDPFDKTLDSWGSTLEKEPLFPDGINVSFAACRSPSLIDLRVWERGAGFTGACGTGACATFAIALEHQRVQETDVRVHQLGGDLILSRIWSENRPKLQLVGPARTVYEGKITL